MHQNCLCTITSSYRQLANNYTLLPNASITYTICRPEIPLHIYPSVVDNSLDIIIQRWLNTYHYARIYPLTVQFLIRIHFQVLDYTK